MKIIKILCTLSAMAGMSFALHAQSGDKNGNINLWNGKVPGKVCSEPESVKADPNIKKLTNISNPSMDLFLLGGYKKSPLVIICPGGGYAILSYDLEGTELAKWLNSIGISAAILKYRTPDNRDGALQDLQRAVRLARKHADEWNILPNKIGVMGFSAGGHLCARLSNTFDKAHYEPIDSADSLSARPDFCILGYPAYLAADKNYSMTDLFGVSDDVPPTFVMAALDDKVWVDSAIAYTLALKKSGAKVDLHLFAEGGHGTGIRHKQDGKPMRNWNDICADWLRYNMLNSSKIDKPHKPKEVYIQLYSVQPEMKKDAAGTLKKLSELGFAGIEAADYNDGKFYGLKPKEFRVAVEEAGLEVVSSHVVKTLSNEEIRSGDFSKSMAWWNKAIADHKAAGMKYIIMAWAPFPASIDTLKAYCKYFNEVGLACKSAGLKFGYHNHAGDFSPIKMENGSEETSLDYILKNTDPDLFFVQLDTYNTVVGKGAPAEFIKKFPGRFKLVHIKDKYVLGESGMVGFDAVFKNVKTGATEGIILEQEGSEENPYPYIAKSMAYLQNSSFVPNSYSAQK